MIRSRASVVTVVASVVLVACGGSDPGPPSAAGPTSEVATTRPDVTSSLPSASSSTVTTEPLDPPVLPSGPAWPLDFPDPFLLGDDRLHHAYATTSGFFQTQYLQAPDLSAWDGPREVLPDAPPWAVPLSVWAPAVLERGDGAVLYFTAQVGGTDMHCIASAVGASPSGPFEHLDDEPLLCPTELGGSIDPSPFVDVDQTLHLLWKNDGVTLRQESAIWSQRLSADGRSLVGEPALLIRTDQRWEYPHVEAPSMARIGDEYWLLYSGNWWNQGAYGIGAARCTSPRGPCEKPFDGPVLTSRAGAFGPGGAEFFRDRSGRLLVAYHAWLSEPGYPGHRALHVAEAEVLGIGG